MAADRQLPVSTTPGAVTGNNYMDAVNEEVFDLTNRAIYQLTSVSGTDTITASVEVPLVAGLVDGMRFVLVPANTTTSTTILLNIQTTGNKNILTNLGSAPRVGALVAGGKYLLEYNSTDDKYYLLTYIPPSGFDDRASWRNVAAANGGCKVWQRGSSVSVPAGTTSGAYTLDRWYLITNTNQLSTVFRASFQNDRSEYAAAVQRNSGQTGTGGMVFACPLTTEECSRLRGSKCTLSFRVLNGANWSPASSILTIAFYTGDGAEGKRGAGFSSEDTLIGPTDITLNTTVNFSGTSGAIVPNDATQGEIRFTWTPTGTAGAQDWFVFDKLQLETGEAATEFEFTPFDRMLAECQRTFAKTFQYATAPAQSAGLAGSISSGLDVTSMVSAINGLGGSLNGAAYGPTLSWRFPVRMRTTPTIVTYNPSAGNANIRMVGAASDSTVTVSPNGNTSDSGVTFTGTGVAGAGTITADHVGYLHVTASAEL